MGPLLTSSFCTHSLLRSLPRRSQVLAEVKEPLPALDGIKLPVLSS